MTKLEKSNLVCADCGHEIFNRGGMILHRKDMYSGKLCLDCNCITPRMAN